MRHEGTIEEVAFFVRLHRITIEAGSRNMNEIPTRREATLMLQASYTEASTWEVYLFWANYDED